MPPLLRVDSPAYRHPPYQGGQGGSNLKSIFNLIITSYISNYLLPPQPPPTSGGLTYCLLPLAHPNQEVDFALLLSIYDR